MIKRIKFHQSIKLPDNREVLFIDNNQHKLNIVRDGDRIIITDSRFPNEVCEANYSNVVYIYSEK